MISGGTFLNFILDQLADLEDLSFRKTYGGVKFFYKDLEFGLIQEGKFKLQSEVACDGKDVEGLEVKVRDGKPLYTVTVPEEVLSNKNQFTSWVKKLLDFRTQQNKGNLRPIACGC